MERRAFSSTAKEVVGRLSSKLLYNTTDTSAVLSLLYARNGGGRVRFEGLWVEGMYCITYF